MLPQNLAEVCRLMLVDILFYDFCMTTAIHPPKSLRGHIFAKIKSNMQSLLHCKMLLREQPVNGIRLHKISLFSHDHNRVFT